MRDKPCEVVVEAYQIFSVVDWVTEFLYRYSRDACEFEGRASVTYPVGCGL